MKNKLNIAIFAGPEGHLSIAQGIYQALEKDHQPQLIKLTTKASLKAYMPFYRLFPNLFKVPFKLSELDSVKKLLKTYVNQSKLSKEVWMSLAKIKPDVVISSWFYVNHVIEEYCQETNTPFINTITDPRTFSSIISNPKAINLVFDNHTEKACKKLGISQKNIQKTGWYVRKEYEASYNKSKIRHQLGIDQNDLTFLVCGGSDGTNLVLKIIPALIIQKKRLRIYFACGSNKTLLQTIKAFSKLIKRTHKNLSIVPLPFTKELYKYMQAADLVIGKAGPSLLFESVATLTPFFAITHISGQEDGNLDIIKQYKLGYVEENPIKATRLAQKIINNPKKLNTFNKHLVKMKSYNQQSKKILNKLILKAVPSEAL